MTFENNDAYKDDEVVKIFNPLQVCKYMKQGVNPVNMYADQLSDRIVFVFYKIDTRELYHKWLKHEI